MKKKVASIILIVTLIMQGGFFGSAMGVYADTSGGASAQNADNSIASDKDNELDESYTVKNCKFLLPEGKTKNDIKAGDTFDIEVTLERKSKRADYYRQVYDYEGYLEWEYFPEGSSTPSIIRTEAKARFTDMPVSDDNIDVKVGEPFTVAYTVKLNKFMLKGNATLKNYYVKTRGTLYDTVEPCGYRVENGKLIPFFMDTEAKAIDYDKSFDFSVKGSDIRDLEKPSINSIKMLTDEPVYSSTELEWEVGYSDDFSGVKNVQLQFSNGKKDLYVNGSVDSMESTSGKLVVKGSPGDDKNAIGDYKLVKATVWDYGQNAATYTPDSTGNTLVGDNGGKLNVITFTAKYLEKGVIVTGARVLKDGKEAGQFINTEILDLELTLRNTSDESVFVSNVRADLKDQRGDNGKFTLSEQYYSDLEPGQEVKVTLSSTLGNIKNGEFSIESIYGDTYGGDKLFEVKVAENKSTYMGNLIVSPLDVGNLRVEILAAYELDKEAPYLAATEYTKTSFDLQKNNYADQPTFDLILDDKNLGYAGLEKVKVVLYDVNRPEKNIIEVSERTTDINQMDENRSRYRIYFSLDSRTAVESTYSIKSITVTDENNNSRSYQVCSDGKLGEVTGGNVPAKGTVNNLSWNVINANKPDADFDGPVLKNISFNINSDNPTCSYIEVKLTAEDPLDFDLPEVYLTDGENVILMNGFMQPKRDGNNIDYTLFHYYIEHRQYTLHSVVIKDRSVRKNTSTYIYDSASNTLKKDGEKVEAKGGNFKYFPHQYEEYVSKATLQKNGYISRRCVAEGCDVEFNKEIIYRPSYAKLSDTSFEYDGKNHVPEVLDVFDTQDYNMYSGNYSVCYPENSVNPGTYYIDIVFSGYYEGTMRVPYVIKDKNAQMSITGMSYDDSNLADKSIVKITLTGTWKDPLTKMKLKFTSGQKYLTLEPTAVESNKSKTSYTFTYSTKSLPKGYNVLAQFTLYDGKTFKNGTLFDFDEGEDYSKFVNDDLNLEVICDKIIVHEHEIESTVYKASPEHDGEIIKECKFCEYSSQSDLAGPAKIKLSTTSYTYDGKVKKPTVKVTDSNNNTISSSNYDVVYNSGCKYVGRYGVTVKFKGKYYEGTLSTTFDITPKSTTMYTPKAGKKYLTAKWKKQSTQVSGYVVEYSTSKNFTTGVKAVTITSYKTTSKKITKLTSKKTYYVRVRTYKKTKYNGETLYMYSKWSSAKSVKVK